MSKTFREYHLINALNSFDLQTLPLDVHLNKYFRKHRAVGSKDRKCISEKIYHIIRWLGLIDHFCPSSHNWIERYKILEKMDWKKQRENLTLPLHIRASFPKNFFQILLQHFGEKNALSLCLASNTCAPTTIRVNLLKTKRQKLYAKWRDQFAIVATKCSPWGIIFEDKINFYLLDAFQQGLFEVQDEASQLISDLVEAKPGDQVLDYCSGSGGKTLAFAHKLQTKGQIYLHDIRARALLEAKRRLKRAGVQNAQVLPHDASHKKKLKEKMDWVLVDVPCTGSGTLRRNPDLKWKFTADLLERLIQEQRQIFNEALAFLKPEGRIVYATCSILPQENEEQIAYFQEKHGLDLVSKPFRSLPTEGGMDGFFGAVLKPTRSNP